MSDRAHEPETIEKMMGANKGGQQPRAMDEQGSVGKQFTEQGGLGGMAEKLGGPFSKEGAIGKQFTTEGHVGGNVQSTMGGTKDKSGSGSGS